MFKRDGKRREMGLGPVRDVSLAEARQRAEDARRPVAEGRDPIVAKSAAAAAQKEAGAAPTFGEFADELVTNIEGGFRNAKHAAQWRMTLGPTYCGKLRGKRLDDITTDDVLTVLSPIWQKKNEAASRLRGRIERVLDAAKAKGLRSGENPARWRGHLNTLLSKRQKLQKGHHAALPYADMPAFVAGLRAREAVAARALEFAILTIARSGEVLGATWNEIDLAKKIWMVPAGRMKGGSRAPCAAVRSPLLPLLKGMEPLRAADDGASYVFPGQRPKRPLSGMAMAMLLRRQKHEQKITVHGFRSSFRHWVGEETSFASETAEASMSHAVGDATERAYRRGDALEKRREVMEAWAAYCLSEPEKKAV
uniref:Putative P4 family integrase n=2 Tax=Paracoccus methylutens TaxID=135742 RepID=A7UBQ8_9RHOB|nr:putative P4 family integrase [Paracoccus methylutens]